MSVRRFATVAGIVLGSLVLLAVVAVAAVAMTQEGEIRPGVSVSGIDVGGLDTGAAAQALEPLAAARGADPVTVRFRDREFVLSPSEIGFGIDLDATVQEAMEVGREGGFLDRAVDAVRAYWNDRSTTAVTGWDDASLDAWVEALANDLDRDPAPGVVSADPSTLEVTAVPPNEGVSVVETELRDALLDGLRTPGPVEVELPVEITPPRVDAADVEAVATQARRALEAPLVVEANGTSVRLRPRDLAAMIALREVSTSGDQWTVELSVPVDVVEETFGDIAGRFEVPPVTARFEVPRTPPTTLDDKDDVTWSPRPADVAIVPSQPGSTFDADLAAAQLSEVLSQGLRRVELRLAEVEAELTTDEARDLSIDTLLSTFTTYHACCQSRVNNIQRLADLVDGTLVLPGEQFSINQISGERTCSKGFSEAGMILRGEIVDVCGGGVSQFGTTTVNAVFFAGLKPDTYQPHSFYISRYPMGREATLNYPSPDIDVRFTNDTGNGILVKTSYTKTSITVSFYGSSDVTEVRAIHGQPYNVRPYPTERRVNRSLPPQTERVIQSGKNGFSVNVDRVVVLTDGSEATDDWSNRYVPETEIIEYNPDPAPSPSPSPSPSSSPSPSPSPSESEGQ